MQVRDEDFDNVNPGEPHVLIPNEGWYPAEFDGVESKFYGSWGEKLIVQWKVFTSNDLTAFKMIPRYYNVERDKGNRFKFGEFHEYRRDWIRSNRGRHPLVRSRLPLSIWKQSLFFVEVETVRRDSKGGPLAASFHWSKIGRVIRPVEEGETWEGLPVQPLNLAGE